MTRWARLEVDDNVKVVVVTGEGGNFSAGQDLKKFFSASWKKDPAGTQEGPRAAAQSLEVGKRNSTATTSPQSPWCTVIAWAARFMQLLACDFAIAAEECEPSHSPR